MDENHKFFCNKCWVIKSTISNSSGAHTHRHKCTVFMPQYRSVQPFFCLWQGLYAFIDACASGPTVYLSTFLFVWSNFRGHIKFLFALVLNHRRTIPAFSCDSKRTSQRIQKPVFYESICINNQKTRDRDLQRSK